MNLKIHIVQKGDTLWELAKKYGVDFEQLKAVNSHLASPDMIMPGMKIKIPTSTKQVKHDTKPTVQKETKKPYYDMSPKPMPVLKEDDVQKQKPVKPEMPVVQTPMPQMPAMPSLDFDLQQLNVQMPVMPIFPPEEKKEEIKPVPKEEKKVKEEVKPVQKEEKKAPVAEKMPEQVPPVPLPMPVPMEPAFQPIPCYYVMPCHPCFPMMMPCMEPAFHPNVAPMHHSPMPDCGCGGGKHEMGPHMMHMDAGAAQHFPYMYGMPRPEPSSGETYPKPPTYPNFSPTQNNNEEEK